ncbi:unnamed protein product, partial [marine sediment metagenome]
MTFLSRSTATYITVATRDTQIENFNTLTGIVNGPNRAETPITAKVLNIFDPVTFPIAISGLPLLTAATVTESSGREVP